MTPAQRDRLTGFNASLKQRGVSVTIQPDDIDVLALIEHVDEKTRQRLQIGSDLISDVVHIRRADLSEVEDMLKVSEIVRNDSSKTFRVEHFEDDPQRPSILFYCKLATAS